MLIERFLDWFRKGSWLAIFVGCLMAGNAELGIPPDKVQKPKSPLWQRRLYYLGDFGLGAPGASWGIVRASQNRQRTPWGDRE